MDDALLETWIQTVNETAEEYGVTLLVGGWIVTGHLTPTVRYRDWLREVGRRVAITKGDHRLPGGRIGSITEQQADKARAEWEKSQRTIGFDESRGDVRFCLRDAAVGRPDTTTGWTQFPFLVLSLGSVDGFCPVRLKT